MLVRLANPRPVRLTKNADPRPQLVIRGFPEASQFSNGRVTVPVAALASEGGAALVDSMAGVFLLARTGTNTAIEGVYTPRGVRW